MEGGVQFEEDDPILNPQFVTSARTRKARKTGSIINMIIRWKLAKDEKQANGVLLTVAIIFIVIAGLLVYESIPHKPPASLPVVQADLSR